MNAVADLFVGPNLHMVQGSALTRDEFVDERFRQAEVIHLASPAIFDLTSPSRSRIYLSDSRTEPGGEYLDAQILRSWRLNVSLLVLSAGQMTGSNQHSFINRTPLLADFLDVGVRSILFSLWQNNDVIVASFIADFYNDLLGNSSPVESLYAAKRRQISSISTEGDGAGILRLWSGFQMVLN